MFLSKHINFCRECSYGICAWNVAIYTSGDKSFSGPSGKNLADHLKSLAEEPAGSHIHLDDYNSLEEGSSELILETR